MSYIRALLNDVEGYVPGEQPKDAAVIKLNTNECPYPPSPKVMEALAGLGPDALRKYPDPVALKLRSLCAERFGFPGPEWVLGGNGMDELLALALRTFVDPGDTVIAQYPTYSLYEVLCKLHGCTLQYVELDEDFQLTEEFFAAKGRLAFFTRPNAPTGQCASRDQVARFCENFPGIVIIDEAYVDFAEDSCIDFPQRYDNVLVMRTFSKSFSMAGMRLGMAYGQPALIEAFLKTKDSYNLNAYTQAAGIAAMEDYAWMEGNVAKVKATREQLRTELQQLGFQVAPSQANFLLTQWHGQPETPTLFQTLKTQNIMVRYFNAPRLQNALRITIGTDEECDKLVAALRGMVSKGEG